MTCTSPGSMCTAWSRSRRPRKAGGRSARPRWRNRKPRKDKNTTEDAEAAQRPRRMTDDEIGHAIIGAAMKVHSTVGPGLLESAYEACLTYELEKKEIVV